MRPAGKESAVLDVAKSVFAAEHWVIDGGTPAIVGRRAVALALARFGPDFFGCATQDEVAAARKISPRAIRNHLAELYSRFGYLNSMLSAADKNEFFAAQKTTQVAAMSKEEQEAEDISTISDLFSKTQNIEKYHG